jgi:hypothetical protein
MEVFPVTADTIQPPNPAPRLEYPVYFARAGNYDVDMIHEPDAGCDSDARAGARGFG